MSDDKSSLARQWKQLSMANGKKAAKSAEKKMDSKEAKALAKAISEVIAGHAKDIYGTASSEKYKKIVDLIVERASVMLSMDLDASLVKSSLEDAKSEVLAKIAGISSSIDEESIAVFLEDAASKILKKRLDSLVKDLSKIFDDSIKDAAESKKKNEKAGSSKDAEDGSPQEEVPDELEDEDKQDDLIDEFEDALDSASKAVNKQVNVVSKILSKLSTKIYVLTNVSMAKLNSFCHLSDKEYKSIKKAIKKMHSKVAIVIESALSNYLQSTFARFKALVPSPKEAKAKKGLSAVLDLIEKMIDIVFDTLDSVADIVIDTIGDLLDACIKVLSAFILKIVLGALVPFALIVGLLLSFIFDPIMKILTPILDLISAVVLGLIAILREVIFVLIGPLVKFILDVLGPPIKIILDSVADLLVQVLDAVEPHIVAIMAGLLEFASSIFNVLVSFMKGIGSNAKMIGERVSFYAMVFVDVITEFLEGFDDMVIKDIGKDLVMFLDHVMDVLIEFFGGIGDFAPYLGQSLAEFAAAGVDVLISFVDGFR